ncbi:MAG: efflux RND transporter periplasmic adaptor subunit [Cyanobacteria bacterium P01_A01_bin.15]
MLSKLSAVKPFRPNLKWSWKNFALFIVLLLGMRLGIGLLTGGRSSKTELLTQPVEQKTVPILIEANGTVNPERSINLSPKSSGVVQTLLVEEGERVEQGQTIAIMDDSNLQGDLLQRQGQLAQENANLQRLIVGERPENIASAEAALTEAEANLQELKAGNRSEDIAQASARLQQAQATLQQQAATWSRYESLYKEGAISQEELEQKRTDRDVAQAQVKEAEEALALQTAGTRSEQIAQAEARVEQQRQTVAVLKAGNRTEDIAQARAQVQSAQGTLQAVETQLQDTEVAAPFDGVVSDIYAEIGSFVSPSMSGSGSIDSSSSSILMFSSSRNQVWVNLPESRIADVQLGQSVTFKADAFPGEVFRGQVEHIADQAAVSQNVTSFEVKISIDESGADRLKIGMNVEAQFEIGRLEEAMLVPNAAVVRGSEGEGVYVVGEDSNPTFQPIQTGVTVGSQTEVTTGLTGDEQVLISPPSEQAESSGFNFPPAPPPQ